MVKVGDKVKIVSGGGSHAGYENGDVLEVIALFVRNQKDIYVRIPKDVGYTGRGADRPIYQPFAFLVESEYEVVKEKQKTVPFNFDLKNKIISGGDYTIRVGDSFKIIDNPWEYRTWSELRRSRRKTYIDLMDKTATIKDIKLCKLRDKNNQMIEKMCVISDNMNGFIIPVDLIERVKAKRVYSEAEIKDAQRIIGEIVSTIDDCVDLYFDTRGIRTKAYIHDNIIGEAVCLPNDEFNTTIGRMVALCYATGTRLPKWVRE